MAKTDSKKAKKTNWSARIVILVVIGTILGISLLFERKINAALGFVEPPPTAPAAPAAPVETGGELSVHFIDVGQGDSCVIRLPDARTVLIDGGDNGEADKIKSYISENIFDADGNAITYFDFAILTHTDSDHCGSMDEVISAYPAKVFYRPNVLCDYRDYDDPADDAGLLYGDYKSKDTRAYYNILAAAYAYEGVEMRVNRVDNDPIVPEGKSAGDPGYYSLSFYGPSSAAYKDWNNYSPIMILEYEGERFALSGDCEKEGEKEFVDLVNEGEGKFAVFDENYSVSVIKLGHHGSRTSTGVDYVEAITTESSRPNTYLVVSCGKDNQYGHPHAEKLDQLLNDQHFSADKLLRTDEIGDIVFSVRYDEAAADYALFYGGTASVRRESRHVSMRWLYIAITLFAVTAFVLVITPLMPEKQKKKSRR